MAWCWICDKPFSDPMLIPFTDAYMRHLGELIPKHRVDSRFASSQWDMVLPCNNISYWLGASLESDLKQFQWQFLTNTFFSRCRRGGEASSMKESFVNIPPEEHDDASEWLVTCPATRGKSSSMLDKSVIFVALCAKKRWHEHGK